jgi:hypothetical protein
VRVRIADGTYDGDFTSSVTAEDTLSAQVQLPARGQSACYVISSETASAQVTVRHVPEDVAQTLAEIERLVSAYEDQSDSMFDVPDAETISQIEAEITKLISQLPADLPERAVLEREFPT